MTQQAVKQPQAPRPWRWKREEFYEAARLGWFRGKRVVLLDGELITMPGQGNWHSVTIGKVEDVLREVFGKPAYWVRPQLPLDLPDGTSEPEPDVAVVPGRPDDYTRHPSTALLVVEIADSSVRLDRRKANAYASAGVEDYWIVSLPDHWVEVYRDPTPAAGEEFGHQYQTRKTLKPGDTVTPLAAPSGTSIAVADLLPAQPVGPTPDPRDARAPRS